MIEGNSQSTAMARAVEHWRAAKLNGFKVTVKNALIPTVINQNPCAHFRRPMDMIFQG